MSYTPNPADADDELLQRAKRRVGMKMGFYIHALVFTLVNLGLYVLNNATGTPRWSHFPLWGCGALALMLVATARNSLAKVGLI